MCGSSSQQQNAYNQAQSVQTQFVTNMNSVFGENQNILASILGPVTKTLAAGPNQYGFSPEEDAARKSNILATNSAATRQASNAAGEKLASIGGADSILPSGSKAAITGQIAEQGAQTGAAELQQETAQGYDVGRQQYNTANQVAEQAPGALENPSTAMESPALAGTENLGKSADQITASNRSWEKDLTGALGGVLDVATGGLSGAIGKIGDAADSAANSV